MVTKSESYEIVDRSLAPAENVLLTFNRNGIVDDVSRRLAFFKTISWPLLSNHN